MNRQAQSPTVSVMIPYYNCKEYIVETIQSVLSQSHQNFEIIIVDDGSDPEHADYLKGFLADKPAIRYAVQNNQGVAAARNHAARLAGGQILPVSRFRRPHPAGLHRKMPHGFGKQSRLQAGVSVGGIFRCARRLMESAGL